jgi:tetratricopeptide (TPR) repeat protein
LATDRPNRKVAAAVYQARAQAQAKLGHHAAAAEDFTRALELLPDSALCHAGRGWAYLAVDAPGLALGDFEHVLYLDPDDADAYNGRGLARVKRGLLQEGLQDAQRVLGLADAQPLWFYNAARVHAQALPLLIEKDGAPSRLPGFPRRAAIQERAILLLRKAMEALPAEERPGFWKDTILRDAVLNPLRDSPGFLELAQAQGERPRSSAQ